MARRDRQLTTKTKNIAEETPIKGEVRQLCVDLLQIAPLFPRFCCLQFQPTGQLFGIGIQLL